MNAAALCLLTGSLFVAQVPVDALSIPSEVKGQPGEFITVKATTTAQAVRWVLLDNGPALFPAELLKDTRTAVVVSLKPGKFRLLAYGCVAGDATPPAICLLIVGDQAPPKPPAPPPPPPAPTDPLAAKFQAAYNADPNPVALKAKQRDSLIGLYQAMSDHAKDKKITNTDDLLTDLRKTAAAMLHPTALTEVRKLISAEVGEAIGTQTTAVLDDAARKKAVDVFNRVATSLSLVK